MLLNFAGGVQGDALMPLHDTLLSWASTLRLGKFVTFFTFRSRSSYQFYAIVYFIAYLNWQNPRKFQPNILDDSKERLRILENRQDLKDCDRFVEDSSNFYSVSFHNFVKFSQNLKRFAKNYKNIKHYPDLDIR